MHTLIDGTTRETINTFLADYSTLVIATVDEDQPFATSTFYAEKPLQESDTDLILYGTFITSSHKLTNLRQNPRVGLFIGAPPPTVWLEATARAVIVSDEEKTAEIRERLAQKSSVAASFLTRVPIAAVELHVQWLRITNLTASPPYTEVTFSPTQQHEEPGA